MIDYHKELVKALNTIGIGVHYELALTSNTNTPCISYQERNNYTSLSGDTLGYSVISYTIKVWANDIKTIQKYCVEVDATLRPLGFKRNASNELHDPQSTMIQKIMTYSALAQENY